MPKITLHDAKTGDEIQVDTAQIAATSEYGVRVSSRPVTGSKITLKNKTVLKVIEGPDVIASRITEAQKVPRPSYESSDE